MPHLLETTKLNTRDESTEAKPLGQQWLDEHGDVLFSFAMTRVADQTVAEDVVQETFLAAIKNAKSFQEKSTIRTWLIGILRHKIADHFRANQRRKQLSEKVAAVHEAEKLTGRHFDRKHWGATPESAFTDQEFWRVFEHCREGLPTSLSQPFVLREVEQMKTEEICAILDLKPANLSVRVHRARLLLRKCLETNWFTVD